MYQRFAQLYDRLMGDVDYDLWGNYVTGLLQEQGAMPGSRVLDCACGTGELSCALARSGYNVAASDLSEDMLGIAQQKARKQGLAIHFMQQDLRSLAFHRKLAAINISCDGINYLTAEEDVKACFSSAAALLKEGGLLLFDVSSAYKLQHILGGNIFGEDLGDICYLWRNIYDEKSRLLEMDLTFFVQQGQLYERFCEKHIQRAHFREELCRWLEQSGFEIVGVYEAFGHKPAAENSERLQFVARRK